MALIAIGVTFGSPASSAQVPTTSSGVSSNVIAAGTMAGTIAALGTTMVAQGTTISAQGTTTTNDVAAIENYASAAVANSGTYCGTQQVVVGGSLTVGDTLSITAAGGYTGSPQTASYTTKLGDTTSTMASGLASAITANTTITAAFGTAVASGSTVYLGWEGSANVVYTTHNTGTTETLTLSSLPTDLSGEMSLAKIKALGTTAQADLNTLLGDVSNLQTNLGTLQADITALQSDITAAETILGGMNVFVQADTTDAGTAALLSSALQSALAFALAQGIVSP